MHISWTDGLISASEVLRWLLTVRRNSQSVRYMVITAA